VLHVVCEADCLRFVWMGQRGTWEALPVAGMDEVPLYFQLTAAGTVTGAYARARFEAGDPAAVGGFWPRVADATQVVERFGERVRLVRLLDDLVPSIRAAVGARSSAGAPLPVRLLCVPGISQAARDTVSAYLGEQGFAVAPAVDYWSALTAGLEARGQLPRGARAVLLTVAFGDVQLAVVTAGASDPVGHVAVLPGSGTDPRAAVLAELCLERAAQALSLPVLVNDATRRRQEVAHLLPQSHQLLGQFEYGELRARVALSSETTVTVVVRESEVTARTGAWAGRLEQQLQQALAEAARAGVVPGSAEVLDELLWTDAVRQWFGRQISADRVHGPRPNLLDLLLRGAAPDDPQTAVAVPEAVAERTTVAAAGRVRPDAEPARTAQDRLVVAIRATFPDAVVKHVNKDAHVEIHLPTVHARPDTHLFFKTAKRAIQFGFYVQDADFVAAVLTGARGIERVAHGLRLAGNPTYQKEEKAVAAALAFLALLQKHGPAAATSPERAVAAERAAQEQREREAKADEARAVAAAEQAARVQRERDAAEQAARVQRERDAAEQAARVQRERDAAEQAARVQRERDAAEQAARVQRERDAADAALVQRVRWRAARSPDELVAPVPREQEAEVPQADADEAPRRKTTPLASTTPSGSTPRKLWWLPVVTVLLWLWFDSRRPSGEEQSPLPTTPPLVQEVPSAEPPPRPLAASLTEPALPPGFSPDDRQLAFSGDLATGLQQSHSLVMYSGFNYAIVASCDRACTDLDLGLRSDDGAYLGGDVAADAVPRVIWRSERAFTATVEVQMPACGETRCRYLVHVYRKDVYGDGGGTPPLDDPATLVSLKAAIDALMTSGDYVGARSRIDGTGSLSDSTLRSERQRVADACRTENAVRAEAGLAPVACPPGEGL
jgi:hypothetical protein